MTFEVSFTFMTYDLYLYDLYISKSICLGPSVRPSVCSPQIAQDDGSDKARHDVKAEKVPNFINQNFRKRCP